MPAPFLHVRTLLRLPLRARARARRSPARRFVAGVTSLNRVTSPRVPALLSRIAGALGGAAAAGFAFSEEEEAALCGVLALPRAEVRACCETAAYIFERAALHGLKPPALLAALADAGLEERHVRRRPPACARCARARLAAAAQRAAPSPHPPLPAPCSSLTARLPPACRQCATFAAVWSSESAALLARLRARPLGAPLVLTGTSWTLALGLGSSADTAVKTSTDVLDFALAAARPSGVTAAAAHFSAQFSRAELLALFDKLDRVQQQIDELSA